MKGISDHRTKSGGLYLFVFSSFVKIVSRVARLSCFVLRDSGFIPGMRPRYVAVGPASKAGVHYRCPLSLAKLPAIPRATCLK